jgi:hypothetical protein
MTNFAKFYIGSRTGYLMTDYLYIDTTTTLPLEFDYKIKYYLVDKTLPRALEVSTLIPIKIILDCPDVSSFTFVDQTVGGVYPQHSKIITTLSEYEILTAKQDSPVTKAIDLVNIFWHHTNKYTDCPPYEVAAYIDSS